MYNVLVMIPPQTVQSVVDSRPTGPLCKASVKVGGQEGLSTIITAVFVSRKIFQRMKNFVIYRVACTQQLLLFFFFSCVLLNPAEINPGYQKGFFSIPVLALVTITILSLGLTSRIVFVLQTCFIVVSWPSS